MALLLNVDEPTKVQIHRAAAVHHVAEWDRVPHLGERRPIAEQWRAEWNRCNCKREFKKLFEFFLPFCKILISTRIKNNRAFRFRHTLYCSSFLLLLLVVHLAVGLPHPEHHVLLAHGLRSNVFHHRSAPADLLRFGTVRVLLDLDRFRARLHDQPATAFELGAAARKKKKKLCIRENLVLQRTRRETHRMQRQ